MFLNFSNHPSEKWSEAQIKEASKYGEIIDISFPSVGADKQSSEILVMASEYVNRILNMTTSDDAIMVQGEFTLAYAVIDALLKNGRYVLSACSERIVVEDIGQDGTYKKTASFDFRGFREYRHLQ